MLNHAHEVGSVGRRKGRQQETVGREERGGRDLGIIFQLLPAALSRTGCHSWLRAPAPARRLSSPSPPSASPAGVKAPAVSLALLTLLVASPFPAHIFVKPLHKPSSNCPQRGMLLFPAGTLTVTAFISWEWIVPHHILGAISVRGCC